MNEKITIADIARKVNVSPSTVSRIINQKGKYTEETIDKVQEAIQELGYSPNIVAKTLRSKKSNLVGIMLSDITNDFFNSLADNLVRELISYYKKRSFYYNRFLLERHLYDYKFSKIKNIQSISDFFRDKKHYVNFKDEKEVLKEYFGKIVNKTQK